MCLRHYNTVNPKFKMIKRTLLMLLVFNIANVYSNRNYGSFNLTMTDVQMCRGPKHKDCSIMKAQISSHNVLQCDMNVTQNFVPTKGKIIAITNGNEYLRLQMKKPCEHLFLKPIIYSIYNITKDCVILKGRYQYSVDVQKITQSYYGGSFLLGNWTFKSLFYSDECNFYCLEITVRLF